jgi:hypothetical protein
MNSRTDWQDGPPELEAILLAAGNYVRASDDLRPRVLESARTAVGQQRGQRRVRRLSLVGAFLSVSLSGGNSTGGGPGRLEDIQAMYRQAALKAPGAGELGWGLVQAYSDLRQRQSEILKLE